MIGTFLEVLIHHSAPTPRHLDSIASTSIADIGPLTKWTDSLNSIAKCFDSEVSMPYHQITSADEGDPLQEMSHTMAAADHLAPHQSMLPQTIDGLNPRNDSHSDHSLLFNNSTSTIYGTSQGPSLQIPESTITYSNAPLTQWRNANPNNVPNIYESPKGPDYRGEIFPATSFCSLNTTNEKAYLPGRKLSQLTPARHESPFSSQIIKKLGKRRRLPSFLSRKRQRIVSPQPTDGREYKTISAVGTPQLATNSPLLPNTTIACQGNELDDDLAPCTVKTDWIAEWEGRRGAGSGFGNPSVVRDVNVAACDRRPMSWPLRHHFRKSIDVSVAVLTKTFEQKLILENR